MHLALTCFSVLLTADLLSQRGYISPVWPLPIHRSFASSLLPTGCLFSQWKQVRQVRTYHPLSGLLFITGPWWKHWNWLCIQQNQIKRLRERLIDKELTWNQSRLCCWFQVKSGHRCFSRKWHSDSFLHRQLKCKTSDGLINTYTVGSHPGCVSLHLPNEMIDNTSGRGRVPRQVTTLRYR